MTTYAIRVILQVAFVVSATIGLAQNISVSTKDGSKVNTTISAISSNMIYTPVGNIAFSEMDSAFFESNRKEDQGTYSKLRAAGVKIGFTGSKIIPDPPILKKNATAQPFKGANVIIFKSKISDDSLYTLVARKLVSEGFSIDVNNREFLQMRTDAMVTAIQMFDENATRLRIQLTIAIANRELIVRPTIITSNIFQWTYKRGKLLIFDNVQQIVLDLFSEFGEVYYAAR